MCLALWAFPLSSLDIFALITFPVLVVVLFLPFLLHLAREQAHVSREGEREEKTGSHLRARKIFSLVYMEIFQRRLLPAKLELPRVCCFVSGVGTEQGSCHWHGYCDGQSLLAASRRRRTTTDAEGVYEKSFMTVHYYPSSYSCHYNGDIRSPWQSSPHGSGSVRELRKRVYLFLLLSLFGYIRARTPGLRDASRSVSWRLCRQFLACDFWTLFAHSCLTRSVPFSTFAAFGFECMWNRD